MDANEVAQMNARDEERGKYAFLYELWSAPCFRESTLYGIGGGAAIGCMQMLRSRAPMESAETMVKTGCAISLLSWVLCRRRYYEEREATYGTLQRLRRSREQHAAQRAHQLRQREEREQQHGDERAAR